MWLKFLSLASGSSGNCYYLGNASYGILIDSGIAVRTIKKVLKDNGIAFESIVGVFITHDHSDHIKTVGSLGKRHHIPVYTTELIHQGIVKSRWVAEDISFSKRIIQKDTPLQLFDFVITPFEVPHDGIDNIGFLVQYNDIQIVIATDLGYVPEKVAAYLRRADYLALEANYDDEMLTNGRYPFYLKTRIKSDTGHLCNTQTGDCLANIYTKKLKHVFLCHLSKENNHPELAYKTVETRLLQAGIMVGEDLRLTVLKRNKPTEMIYCDK
ncbi:MAG: MBL fold metallo-hydrolase [Bacteroidales bacterium]|nr:MBL fold metallo-hydrolase [Bacteroidales bacterium]